MCPTNAGPLSELMVVGMPNLGIRYLLLGPWMEQLPPICWIGRWSPAYTSYLFLSCQHSPWSNVWRVLLAAVYDQWPQLNLFLCYSALTLHMGPTDNLLGPAGRGTKTPPSWCFSLPVHACSGPHRVLRWFSRVRSALGAASNPCHV